MYPSAGQAPAAPGQYPAASGQYPAAPGQYPAAPGQYATAPGTYPPASAAYPQTSGAWQPYPSGASSSMVWNGQAMVPAVGQMVDPSAPYGRDPMTGQPLSDKSKVVAGLLQIFLSGLGVGRFYIGDNRTGAIQLAMTIAGFITTFIFVGFLLLAAVGIWCLIDGIRMLVGDVPDARGFKLKS